MPDPIAFAQPTNNQIHISPQLALATFQFLQTGEQGSLVSAVSVARQPASHSIVLLCTGPRWQLCTIGRLCPARAVFVGLLSVQCLFWGGQIASDCARRLCLRSSALIWRRRSVW